MDLLLALLLAAGPTVQTVTCTAISACEEQAAEICGFKTYEAVALRGPYKDGRFELDFYCRAPKAG